MFGAAAKPAAAGLFGAAPSGGGLFGAAPAFGTPSAGAFGAAPATPSFGAPAAGGGLFGAASAAPAFGAAAPATPFGGATYPGAATPFGAAPAATPAFGAFGAPAAAPSAPAFGSAFGAPAAAASTPFGSAFGAAAPAAGAFPFGSAAAKPAAPAFGAGAFGAPAAASTGLFGAPAAAPSAFGAPAAGAFGAPAASTGLFGAPAAATPAFGAAAPAFGGSAFGAAATSTAFGAAAPGAGSIFGGAAAGGGLKFQPTTESETNGQQTTQVKFFSITAMPQASGQSFEEIRLNDYMAGRRGGPAPAAAATGSIFGAPAPAAASPFGAPAASPFGAPAAAPAFGAPAASTGLFGAPAPTAAPAFGAPAGGLFGAPAAAPAPNIFGAPAAAPAFGAPAAGGLFGAPTTAQTSASLFGASAPAFGAPAASTPGFGAGGLSGGLGAFSSLSTPAPAANPSLSFPGLGAPAAGGSIFAGLGAPAASPFGAPTSSSLFPTTAPSLSAYPSAGSGASLFPAFGAPAAGTSAASMYGVAQPTLEVRLNTPGAFGALPAVASSLTVPPAPAAQAVALPAAPASVGKKAGLAPLLRMTPSSAAKLKPRAAGRSFVYDSLADPAAAPVPEAFAPRSDLRRLILEPEDAPTPARAATAPASVLAAVALSSPASATSPVSPAPAPATQNGAAPAGNGGVGASGVVRPKASKPPRGSLSVLSPSHESPLASPAREEAGEAAPQLTRADYYTEPPIEALHAMHDDELRRVRNFAVGRTGVGRVAFDGDTDVRGLNLDELVHFNAAPREIEVYPEGTAKPDVGRGLNKPATVTLEACFPAARPGASSTDPERLALYEERLRKFTANIDGASFVAYDRSTGRWTFRVRHFSKYGLAGLDDDDDDGPDAAAKPPAKRPAGPPAPAPAAAKASAKPAAPIAAPAALRALPLRSPAASALSIEEPEGDEEEEVLRGRGAPRLSLSVHEADEQDDEGMAGRDEGDDELEPLEAYGAAAVEEPEEADFAEADEPADEDEPRPARRPAVAPLRREQMREHLFPQSDEAMPPAHDQRDQDEEARDDEEDGAASMMEPPTMSLLPTSLFPPRGVHRSLSASTFLLRCIYRLLFACSLDCVF